MHWSTAGGTMGHKLIRGTIEYTSRKPDRMGEVRGREIFTLSCQPDGTDVLLAHCEIDDPPKVTRDVCLALRHADSSPIDCSVREELLAEGLWDGAHETTEHAPLREGHRNKHTGAPSY